MANAINDIIKPTALPSNVLQNAANGAMGKDDFLKLLTTELRNQNPLEPMDNKDFVAQMAQFSSLEQMNNVALAVENLNSSMSDYYQIGLLTQGATLIGKEVSGMSSTDGVELTGIVDSVMWGSGTPQLKIRLEDGSLKDLDIALVLKVKDPTTSATPSVNDTADADGDTTEI